MNKLLFENWHIHDSSIVTKILLSKMTNLNISSIQLSLMILQLGYLMAQLLMIYVALVSSSKFIQITYSKFILLEVKETI
jgi:hypothetical protein